jgi:hypothetical protein
MFDLSGGSWIAGVGAAPGLGARFLGDAAALL